MTTTRSSGSTGPVRRGAVPLAALALALTLVLTACGASKPAETGGGAEGYQGQTIRLGAVISITGFGGSITPEQRQGLQLAVEDVNAAGGVKGAKLALDVQDDASTKEQAARVTQRLAQEGRVLALLGPSLSTTAPAAHPIADQLRTPMLAISNSGRGIVGNCPYPCSHIYRISQGAATILPLAVRTYVERQHPASAALMYLGDDKFSSDANELARDALTQQGVRVAREVRYTSADVDLAPFVTQALQARPSIIFLSALGPSNAKVLIEARRQGFTGGVLGTDGFGLPDAAKAAGASGTGAWFGTAWDIGNDNPVNVRFVRAFRDRFKVDPSYAGAWAYTGVLVLADAAGRAGLSFNDLQGDRRRLLDALQKTDMDTPLGRIHFGPDHDIRQTSYIMTLDGRGGSKLVAEIPPQ